VLLFAALCGSVAALITVGSSAKPHAQAPAGQGSGAVPLGEALFTLAQAVAGKAAYEQNRANCHGPIVDDGNSAPPLRGAAFLGKYAGKPAADLFTYVTTKMPLAIPEASAAPSTRGLSLRCFNRMVMRPDARSSHRRRQRSLPWPFPLRPRTRPQGRRLIARRYEIECEQSARRVDLDAFPRLQ
jgi:hypothetical protein